MRICLNYDKQKRARKPRPRWSANLDDLRSLGRSSALPTILIASQSWEKIFEAANLVDILTTRSDI